MSSKECPLATSQEACTRCRGAGPYFAWMLERREGGAVDAKGRAGGKLAVSCTRAAEGGEAVAGGSVAEYMVVVIWAARRFFVSHVVLSCALGDSWEGSEQCTSQRESANSLEAPPALSLVLQIVRFVWTRPAFQLCCMPNFHPLNMFRD